MEQEKNKVICDLVKEAALQMGRAVPENTQEELDKFQKEAFSCEHMLPVIGSPKQLSEELDKYPLEDLKDVTTGLNCLKEAAKKACLRNVTNGASYCLTELADLEKQHKEEVNTILQEFYNKKLENTPRQNGLAAGEIGQLNLPEHKEPILLETIDINDKNLVRLKLEEYEKQIVKEPIENAIVITSLGEIIQCFGDKNGVYPDIDLGEKLKGANVTHNHPIDSNNEYSFSAADLMLYQDYKLETLRGIDESYIYELTRNNTDIDDYISLMDMDPEGKDFRHNQVIIETKRQKIGYRRYQRGE